MRQVLLLLLIFTPLWSQAELVKTLTSFNVKNKLGQWYTVPTGYLLQLEESEDPSQVEFIFRGQRFQMDREIFIHSVQAPNSDQLLAELFDQDFQDFNVQDCPVDAQGRLKPGVRWNYAAARALVDFCPTSPVSVVKRGWSGGWSQSCRAPRQDLSRISRWSSCAPPPACSLAEAQQKIAGARKRLESWKLKCAGRNVRIPIDNDPSCTLPLGAPHTVVIHHTEGNMTDGPDAVQRFHMGKGWDDIGYHYILTKTSAGWRAFEGRVDGTEGSHAGAGLNGQTVAIAMSGNYLPSANRGKPADEVLPPPEAMLLMKSLVMQVKRQYPTIQSIYGHGEYKRKGMGCDTDCPSPSQQQFVNRMRTGYFPNHKRK